MSSSFALLHLPLLAQLEVLRRMGLDDLLAFSLISKKTKGLARELRTTIDTLEWQFDNDSAHVIQLDKKLKLEIANDDFELIDDAIEYQDIKLNGTTNPVSLNDGHWFVMEFRKPQSHYLNVMDQFTKHILSVFRVKNFKLQSEREMDFVNLFVWKYTKTFKDVHIIADEFDEIEISFQIDYLFRNLTVSKFYIGLPSEDFKYTGPLTMEHLKTECCDWLTLDAALGMSCREVNLDDETFTNDPSNFNSILKEWIKGDKLRNLEKFEDGGYSHDMTEILEGVETFPFWKKNRPSHWNGTDLSKGMDIRRVDGTLATIYEDHPFLSLYVWHPKYLL